MWVDVPVDCTDIFPTLLDYANYDVDEVVSINDLDGRSIRPLVENPTKPSSYKKDTHYWHYPFNVIYKSPYDDLALNPHSAIRKRDYKLIFDLYGR